MAKILRKECNEVPTTKRAAKFYTCKIGLKTFHLQKKQDKHLNISSVEDNCLFQKPYPLRKSVSSRDVKLDSSATSRRKQNWHYVIRNGDVEFVCDLCQLTFSERKRLSEHLADHRNRRLSVCDICQKVLQERSLPYHRRMHAGENLRPFVCGQCNKAFSDSSAMKTHMKFHTGERDHCCDICQKSFASKVKLRTHLRVHTGEKPYVCDICQKAYCHKSQMNKHWKDHHRSYLP